jgi:cadmium resistance protein CadD (predicted permease)
MEKVMHLALGGCGEALKVLSAVFGTLMAIGIILGCGIFMIPIEALNYTSEKLTQQSEVQA